MKLGGHPGYWFLDVLLENIDFPSTVGSLSESQESLFHFFLRSGAFHEKEGAAELVSKVLDCVSLLLYQVGRIQDDRAALLQGCGGPGQERLVGFSGGLLRVDPFPEFFKMVFLRRYTTDLLANPVALEEGHVQIAGQRFGQPALSDPGPA